MKLPAFWLDKPTIWFAQAEAQFALAYINTELTKYYHVISQLDVRTATEVEDIISNPSAELPNTSLRQKLIERLFTSKEQQVRQLLQLMRSIFTINKRQTTHFADVSSAA